MSAHVPKKASQSSQARAALALAPEVQLPGGRVAGAVMSGLGLPSQGDVVAELVHPATGGRWRVVMRKDNRGGRHMVRWAGGQRGGVLMGTSYDTDMGGGTALA